MQQQPYPNYPYYGQPMYHPQTPYMGQNGPPPPGPSGYPQYYGPQPPPSAPQHPNPPAPSPYSFDPAAYTTQQNVAPTTNAPRRHRRNPTIPAATAPPTAPLKSAMKKTMAVFNAPAQFHNPFSSQPQNQVPTQMPRPRVYSNPSVPQPARDDDRAPLLHMIISFHGYNELHIEHILPLALEELRRNIWPIWLDGFESDTVVDHTCIVKFRNAPWDLSGPNSRRAYKFIVEFFRLFQRRGYTYHTAANMTTTTPRLLFQVTQPNERIVFFIAYFSQEGRRLTLIDPPNHIDISIGARLKSLFPRKMSDDVVEENTRVIEIKRKPNNSPEVEPSVFLIYVLKILVDLGFELDAILPLGRRGALGMRTVRELYIFKGIPP